MPEELKSTPYLNKLAEILSTNNSVKQEAISTLGSKVSFEVSNKKTKTVEYWLLDSKDTGELKKVDSIVDDAQIKIKVADADLKKLIIGKASAQKLFMTGKLKIKGNVMKAANIEKLLKLVGPSKAKL
ncbi:hypothetical protein CANARDRAFT_6361 [[Candida] arabinofermentans NRRL YB-2248]|uniref:SCP2 domain-containing protein n=1 Tax=[Candida] arabinofermentans NRRL YB-2248 TaxID=983967 RepID=A0A1E4T4Z3_9ASCO|nr:hypothetical protein CANARDRAFT_6361 [[Candida] arabinofermentans NRRL YB-2248]